MGLTRIFESDGKFSRYLSLHPVLVLIAGGLIFLIGISQAILELFGDGSVKIALFHLILVGFPGTILMYAGYWMPRSDISPQYYPRVIAWIVGGTGVMFSFIVLRDFHPGVTVEWTVGTQSIALMIGSIGGLLIGIEESRVKIRTEELKKRTSELKDRKQHLARQNKRLEDFANVVSHDLRNPLNVSKGRINIARENRDSEHLNAAAEGIERSFELIDDLLALARGGQDVSEREAIELAKFVEDCWETVETPSADLRVDVKSTIRADRSRLRQLLENLFRNSVEHGGDDVTVNIGSVLDGFYVEDDGSGIPEGEREDVFKKEYSESQEGTGFGLSIVKQIVEAHDWNIQIVEGSAGGGRFEITGVDLGDG